MSETNNSHRRSLSAHDPSRLLAKIKRSPAFLQFEDGRSQQITAVSKLAGRAENIAADAERFNKRMRRLDTPALARNLVVPSAFTAIAKLETDFAELRVPRSKLAGTVKLDTAAGLMRSVADPTGHPGHALQAWSTDWSQRIGKSMDGVREGIVQQIADAIVDRTRPTSLIGTAQNEQQADAALQPSEGAPPARGRHRDMGAVMAQARGLLVEQPDLTNTELARKLRIGRETLSRPPYKESLRISRATFARYKGRETLRAKELGDDEWRTFGRV